MQHDLDHPTTISTLARKALIGISLVLAVGLTSIALARGEQERPRIVWVGRGPMVAAFAAPRSEPVRHVPPASDVAPAPAEPTPDEPSSGRVVMMEVTAYCPCTRCCGPDAQGITASGKHVDYNDGRFVAADTRVLPFGTRVTIPGYGDAQPVEVIDRGGAIKGNKLDVFFASHEEALQWGRQKLPVMVEQ
jgi:3D (Asp-Asp-Asp) domain-containing protein